MKSAPGLFSHCGSSAARAFAETFVVADAQHAGRVIFDSPASPPSLVYLSEIRHLEIHWVHAADVQISGGEVDETYGSDRGVIVCNIPVVIDLG